MGSSKTTKDSKPLTLSPISKLKIFTLIRSSYGGGHDAGASQAQAQRRNLFEEEVEIDEATYQGKTVSLNKPMSGELRNQKYMLIPMVMAKHKK